MSIFTSTPGFAGFYGPMTATGTNPTTITFGRGGTPGSRTGGASINNGFLCDQYTITWGRPSQSKRFLNSSQPVAIVGYGTGQLSLTGLVGTYAGFESFIGGGTSGTGNDVCNPLYCYIQTSNNYIQCVNNQASAQGGGVNWDCYNLILSNIQVTGQVQDNGVLFQQANVVFTMGGLKPVSK